MDASASLKVLITGASGQLGSMLVGRFAQHFYTVAAYRRCIPVPARWDTCFADLSRPEEVRHTVRAVRPDIIVNAAAYTAVDHAEMEPAITMAVNGIAPGVLAQEAAKARALLIHFSTDYVFDGSGVQPWSEEDSPSPLNVYGQSKLEGENAIRNAACPHVIIRTSWLYGHSGANCVTKLLEQCQANHAIKMVDDQFGAPTSARFLAELVFLIAVRWSTFGAMPTNFAQTLHATCSGETSRYLFALEVLRQCRAFGRAASSTTVVPIKTREASGVARRPLNSRLAINRLRSMNVVRIPDWRTELRANFPLICKHFNMCAR